MKQGHEQDNMQEGCMHKAPKVNTAPACPGSTLSPVGVTGRAAPPPQASSAGGQVWQLRGQPSTGWVLSQLRVHGSCRSGQPHLRSEGTGGSRSPRPCTRQKGLRGGRSQAGSCSSRTCRW